ncbi:hypothetical protein [Bosea caraganae]|nr:hypothetical protein [Bosea caraganae]
MSEEHFEESDDLGRSLVQNVRQQAIADAKRAYGDRGERTR